MNTFTLISMLTVLSLSSFGNITCYFAGHDSTERHFVNTTFKLTGKPSKMNSLPQKEAGLFFVCLVFLFSKWFTTTEYSKFQYSR